jgi:DNA polymerase-3 subunit delta
LSNSFLTYLDFEKKVKAVKIEPVYYVLASEGYFLNKAGDLLKEKIFGAGGSYENYFLKYGDEISADDIISLCSNFSSLFSSQKVVLVKKCEKIGRSLKDLLDYCKKPDPDTTLLLAFDKEYVLEKKLNKEKELKFYDFTDLPDDQFREWIKARVTEYGCTIEENAIDEILNSLPRSFEIINSEIAKISNYFTSEDSSKVITAPLVLKFTGYDSEYLPFDLISAIIRNDAVKALEILNNLLNVSKVNEVYLLSIINGSFMDMLAAGKDFEKANKNEYFTKYKLWADKLYFIQTHYKYIKNKDFSSAFQKILDTDLKMKTSMMEPSVLLTSLVQELANIH